MKSPSKPAVFALTAALVAALATPAQAGWKLVPANSATAVGTISVSPSRDWNEASAKPGKQGIAWTRDGFDLNGLQFFSGIPSGQPMYRERSKTRNPMPKFDRTMLLPDLVDFLERSIRTQYDVSNFTVTHTAPAQLGGKPGVLVRYDYSLPNDELDRRGEARLAIIGGKLYVMNFQAPATHYFDAGIAEARSMMDAARLPDK